MSDDKKWIYSALQVLLIRILLYGLLFFSLVSFIIVILSNYIPEYCYSLAMPHAIILAGDLIAITIYERERGMAHIRRKMKAE